MADSPHHTTKRWIPLSSAIVATAILVLIAYLQWRDRILPISELPTGLHYISPEDWFWDEHKARLFQQTGWVLLPRTPADQPTSKQASDDWSRSLVGPKVCGECHADKYETFIETAHAKTSLPVSHDVIRGSFVADENRLATRDPGLEFVMEAREDDFYQKVLVTRRGKTYSHEQRIDIITGSANHGQSFLYWKDDRLYELPVTYFTASDRWMNSPGYPDGTADFARPINARCLECHSTYFQHVPETENRFVPSKTILGVTCERCHGPGKNHVIFHRQHPDEIDARFIVHPSLLPRERAVQVCAQCHSGAGKARFKPPFTYRPGEDLGDFMMLDNRETAQTGGVHTANQLGRLALSRCFKESDELTCASCHNPHQNENQKTAIFVERCLKCHDVSQCGKAESMHSGDSQNCIACHMPMQRDQNIRLKGPKTDGLPLIRDHFIRVFSSS